MKTRPLGLSATSEIGFGYMSLNHAYGIPPPPEQARAVLLQAVDLGVTHFDTGALYGFGRNEGLVGATLKPFRPRIFLASKCGMTGVNGKRVIDGRPATLVKTCYESLRRLQTDVIDLYYLHRIDKQVAVEESVGALGELVRAGHVRAIGLSEVSAQSLRRAHAVHPIAAVQSEYSLWTRNPEVAVLQACRELGIALVAFSPLGRGFLAGAVRTREQLIESDIRRGMPRFEASHLQANLALLARLSELARECGCSTAQLALGWLLQKADNILPIPGTTDLAHLADNTASGRIRLHPDVLMRLETLFNPGAVSGARYSAEAQTEIDTEEIPLPK